MSEYNLNRFIDAQNKYYNIALGEVSRGYKTSHWMWFIFPQIKGLGHSYNSEFYGIENLEEAVDYLDHNALGHNLREISTELLKHKGKDIEAILGDIDALKLCSSMTLFDMVSSNDVFKDVLNVFYNGSHDQKTIDLVKRRESL